MALLGVVFALFTACRPTPKAVELPPVQESASIGPGDEFKLHIIGEEDLPTDYLVAPDGSVALPFVNRVKVEGLEPQEIEALVREELIAGEYFTSPVVMVKVTAYNSKKVTVAGEVKEPDSFAFSPGMTLSTAIAKAGGMTPLARTWEVVLVRKTREGNKRVLVDYDAINNNEIPDVPLQAGDKITVLQKVF